MSLRYAARRPSGRAEETFSFAYPALTPHPGSPGLGDMPGYYQSSRVAGLEGGEIKSVARVPALQNCF